MLSATLSLYTNIINSIGNKYIKAAVIFSVFFIIARLVVFIFERYFLKLTAKTKTEYDDMLVRRSHKPLSALLVIIGIKLALVPLGLEQEVALVTQRILSSLIAIVMAFLISAIVDIIINHWGKSIAERTKSKMDDQIIILLHRASMFVIVIIAFIIILNDWGIKIGPLLASLGIAGIAIAFALQSTLSNVFSGISMIVDRTIKVGDVVKIDAETSGKIIDIGIRSTKIKTWNNEEVIVPNGKLADSKIMNYVKPDPSARIVVEFGVEYGSDVDKVKNVVMKEIKKFDNVLKEPEPKIMFMEMGDFALKFKALFWIASYKERFKTKEKATCMIYKALNKSKIGIPFPTSTVYLKKRK